MSDLDAVDSASEQEEVISKTEAQKAFAARDKAKAQLREAQEKLASLEKAQADAERVKAEEEGDLRKQLELTLAEKSTLLESLEEAQNTLLHMKQEKRFSLIEGAVLSAIPDEANRPVAKLAMNSMLSRVSDDTSEEEAAKEILKEFKKTAPHFLQPSKPPARAGIIPPDSGVPTREQMAKATEEKFRQLGIRIDKVL